jgi:enterochelin esterase-like enzyme
MTLDSNRALDERLTGLSIPHTYTEYPGKHNWPYWNEHLLTALPMLLDALKVTDSFDPDEFLPNRSAAIRR